MSDTPRTDKKSVRFSSLCAPDDARWVPSNFARQLERELNAANERIKRLENAGNEVVYWFSPMAKHQLTPLHLAALNRWNAAKEPHA